MPSIEEIRDAAEVLRELYDEGAGAELEDYPTYFKGTALHLERLAELRIPKPKQHKVFVREGLDGPIVYVERHDGFFAGVYVSELIADGVDINESLAPEVVRGELVWGVED